MGDQYEILGPSSGSSRIVIAENAHGRIVFDATTDFGEVRCVFSKDQARKIRYALDELLKI